jgi:hypothetical protein
MIGFDENFQRREGEAARGVTSVGEARSWMNMQICCRLDKVEESRRCA